MTLRELCMTKKPGAIQRKLNQLNIGLSNSVYGGWASKWSIGYHESTLEDIAILKKLIEEDSILLCKAVDHKIELQLDWTRHFGSCPTGPML